MCAALRGDRGPRIFCSGRGVTDHQRRMGKTRISWRNRFLNLALVTAGLLAILLLYAFATRVLAPRVDPHRESEGSELVGRIIQVEVRNGCGVTDLAAIATQFLRRHGFDVVETGNYSRSDVQFSRVVDRVGDMESAIKVARILGIPEDRVEQELREDLFLDASIIIGHDYQSLRPFRQ